MHGPHVLVEICTATCGGDARGDGGEEGGKAHVSARDAVSSDSRRGNGHVDAANTDRGGGRGSASPGRSAVRPSERRGMWGGNTERYVSRIRGRTRFSPADACAASNSSLDTHSLTRPSPWMPLDAASHRREVALRAWVGEGRSSSAPRERARARLGRVVRWCTAPGRLGSARALAIASPRDRIERD